LNSEQQKCSSVRAAFAACLRLHRSPASLAVGAHGCHALLCAGLAREGSEVEALQQALAAIREEQGKLPGLVREVEEALEAEAAAFQRQEAGEHALEQRRRRLDAMCPLAIHAPVLAHPCWRHPCVRVLRLRR
jgi:hypothetical protein